MLQLSRILGKILLLALTFVWVTGCFSNDEDKEAQAFTKQELASLKASINISLTSASDGKPRLKIIESFVMPKDSIYIMLPSNFMRKNNLYERIENLTVSNPAQLYPHQEYPYYPFIKRIDFKKGERIELSYLYKPDELRKTSDEKEVFHWCNDVCYTCWSFES
jgi:hypothetical protein